MKRGTIEHPKTLDFAEAIHAHLSEKGVTLPFEMVHSLACGMIERLWHYTARYAPAGDIGKHSDLRIALAMGWQHSAVFLIETLTKCRLLDAVATEARLYVHDWHDHSDDAADKWLHDKGLGYANGSHTRRGKNEREGVVKKGRKNASRQKRDEVATPSRLSEPRPRPEPRPSSEPTSSSGPRPEPRPTHEAHDDDACEFADSPPRSPGSSPSPDSPSPKDFSDEDGEENPVDAEQLAEDYATNATDGPPFDTSGIDWDRVEVRARQIASIVPPENPSHVKLFCRLAVAEQTAFSESFIADALAAKRASKSRAGPNAHFWGIVKSKASEDEGLDDLAGFLRRIIVPIEVQRAVKAFKPQRRQS